MADLASIVEALKSPLEGERERAIQALVQSRDIRSVQILQKVVSEDESVAVRYLAKKGLFFLRKQLGLEGEPEVAPAADEASDISSPRAETIEEKILLILGGNDDAQKIRLLLGITRKKLQKGLPILLEHDVESEAAEVRSTLILAVGILGGDSELPFLKTFMKDEDPRVRANAVEALEYLGTPKAYPLVVRALSDADNRIRANAIKALRSYGKGNCLALLEKMMKAKKLWMRDSAAYALSLVGGEESLPLLVEAMKDPEPSVQEKARRGLENLADKGVREAGEALTAFPKAREDLSIEAFFTEDDSRMSFVVPGDDPLHADDPQERLAAVAEIVETRDLARLGDLKEAAKQEGDGFVRAKMVIELGRLGDAALVEDLVGFLDDPMDRVRANTVEAMAMADRKAAQPHLVRMLDDKNNRCRANAVVALRDYAAVDIIASLEEMIGSHEVLMRKSAFYAIAEIGTELVGPLMADLLTDEDADLRHKARGFVEMAAHDGESWAQALQGGGEAFASDVAPFEEFQSAPEEDAAAAGESRASAEGAREKLARFRGLDVGGKRRMIEEVKEDICLESYFFLREAIEDPNFEIKIQAKMALRNFDEDFIHVADEGSAVSHLFKPPEIQRLDYRGMKKATELTKDLHHRMAAADQRGYWEGPFPKEHGILNALREDTQEMFEDVLKDEEILKVFLCYQQERLLPFRQGKKTLDSNRYANLLGLKKVTTRTSAQSFQGSFLHSQKQPTYLLAIALEQRLILFLRGWFETTSASYIELYWASIDHVEAEKAGKLTTVRLQVMGEFVEVPELSPDEAKWIYERAKEREDSRMGHQLEDVETSKEMRKLDLLRSGGTISEKDYRTRKAVLDKNRKD